MNLLSLKENIFGSTRPQDEESTHVASCPGIYRIQPTTTRRQFQVGASRKRGKRAGKRVENWQKM